jgi:hypothetical protein
MDSADDLLSLTNAGILAEIVLQARAGSANAAITTALVPTGTTGTNVFTFANTVSNVHYRTTRCLEFRKTAAYDNGSDGTTSGTSASVTLRVPPLGILSAVATATSAALNDFSSPVITTQRNDGYETLNNAHGRYLNPTRQFQDITVTTTRGTSGNIVLVAASIWGDN